MPMKNDKSTANCKLEAPLDPQSSVSKRWSHGHLVNFEGENEKTSSSTTQELVVGSSAEMETKSTHPPLTTIQLAGASASPPCNKR